MSKKVTTPIKTETRKVETLTDFVPVDQSKADEAYLESYEYVLFDLEAEEMVAAANKEELLLPHATQYLKDNEKYITQLSIYQLKSVLS